MPHLVACPDKFRGTASAPSVAAAMARAAKRAGWTCDEAPVSDGGEGLLDVLEGRRRSTRVTGPLGPAVDAEWRVVRRFSGLPEDETETAVIEMARASGLELAGGPEGNDPLRATTKGTGELIAAAVASGVGRVIVGVGGSATTDGGLGCLTALEPLSRLAGVDLLVACDVETTFLEAAEVFAPQKGATPAQVALLTRRLERLAQVYEQDHGVDVRHLLSSGAAGGLAGGLAAVGATLVGGFDLVADLIGLPVRLERADLVITGEGLLDEQSFAGKVVGGVYQLAGERARAIVGASVVVESPLPVISLTDRFGGERSHSDTLGCIEEATAELLGGWS